MIIIRLHISAQIPEYRYCNDLKVSDKQMLADSVEIDPTAPDQDLQCEPRHDKTYKASVRPAKTQISLGIRPV